MTMFISQLLQEPEQTVPAEDRYVTARKIKERFCKVAMHPSDTFARFDKERNLFEDGEAIHLRLRFCSRQSSSARSTRRQSPP
jgi:hypothetical protein